MSVDNLNVLLTNDEDQPVAERLIIGVDVRIGQEKASAPEKRHQWTGNCQC